VQRCDALEVETLHNSMSLLAAAADCAAIRRAARRNAARVQAATGLSARSVGRSPPRAPSPTRHRHRHLTARGGRAAHGRRGRRPG